MITPGDDEKRQDGGQTQSGSGPAAGDLLRPQTDLPAPGTGPAGTADDLHAAIKDMMDLFDMANDLARRGEQVNIDLLAMRVAVLCDAICEADPTISQPFRGDLEALLGHLNLLENTLLRERVQLALNVEAADRRQRAKLAYGRVLPSMSPPAMPKLPDDQSND